MNKDKVGDVLGSLLGLLESAGDVDEELSVQLDQLYDGLLGKYRPLISCTPHIAGRIANDLAPVIVGIVKIANGVASDDSFKREFELSGSLKAERRFKAMNAYINAGFTRPESMALVLADVARTNQFYNSAARGAGSSTK